MRQGRLPEEDLAGKISSVLQMLTEMSIRNPNK